MISYTVSRDVHGTRTFPYEPATLALTNETIVAGNGVANTLARTYDTRGRPTGYAISLGGTAASRSVYSYCATSIVEGVTLVR